MVGAEEQKITQKPSGVIEHIWIDLGLSSAYDDRDARLVLPDPPEARVASAPKPSPSNHRRPSHTGKSTRQQWCNRPDCIHFLAEKLLSKA